MIQTYVKYDENENAGNVEKPYSVQVRGTERTINVCGIASRRIELVRFALLDFFSVDGYNVVNCANVEKLV